MNAKEKYRAIFGAVKSLDEKLPWTTGLSNMLEWLLWSTNDILGVTKTRYVEMILEWSNQQPVRSASVEDKLKYVTDKIGEQLKNSEQSAWDARRSTSIVSPREALRRAKFLSEDYLNKEFDIFWALVSDRYLDSFYGTFTHIKGGSQWASHGNGGLFSASTEITEMQMDNLTYNGSERLLVANELKHGGRKNKDQMLKYALMFTLLRERAFIAPDSRFVLLFIGDKVEQLDWHTLLEEELKYCNRSSKSTARKACQAHVVEVARQTQYDSTSWHDLVRFNEDYLRKLELPEQQVEERLISGFNLTLREKKFVQVD